MTGERMDIRLETKRREAEVIVSEHQLGLAQAHPGGALRAANRRRDQHPIDQRLEHDLVAIRPGAQRGNQDRHHGTCGSIGDPVDQRPIILVPPDRADVMQILDECG